MLVALVLGLAAGACAWLQRSLPQLDGTVAAPGVGAPVEIVRDHDGIPHVFAATERDGWYAVGYAHAQDRLWQMEFQRRVAQGRLAEFLGERAFETDRLMRTLGLARTAERIVANLDAATVANLQAYADGVNAFLQSKPVMPVEFQALRVDMAPWKPADSVAWLLVMSWDLSSNWRSELARLRFAATVGVDRAAQLIPPYPGDTQTPLPDYKALYTALAPQAAALLALSPGAEQAIGSNNWVVSGARSETGKPLLANDPHLGLQAPALWYLVHVQTPAGNVVGGTIPGMPFVVLGHTDGVAWAMTTTNSDTQDLFIEKLVGTDQYLTPNGPAAFEVREEVIRVGSEERRVKVRSTRHGPVLSDAIPVMGAAAPTGHVLALSWAALRDDNATPRAGFAMNRARNADELVAAMRDFHAPHHNVVYADRDSRIGFIAPARVPVRAPDNEAMGRVPVPGWVAKYDWQGFLPFEQLPALRDPASQQVITANHKITPPGYRPFLSVDWFLPWRAERIEALLAQAPKHSLTSFAKIQGDTQSRLARELLPAALAARPFTDEGKDAQKRLRDWDGETAVNSAAPLIFASWFRELTRLVYADELGDMFNDSWEQRPGFMVSVMKGEGTYGKWCDDVTTKEVETCADMAARAFDRAAVDLKRRYGSPRGWRWGEAHVAASDHRPFGFFPLLGHWFNVSPETPGDSYSVDVGHYILRDEARPYANKHAGSLRALYDLADLDRSLFMQSTGQSGNVFSSWYRNFAERWANVEYVTIPTDRAKIEGARTLRLSP